jgi:hypothetical protein
MAGMKERYEKLASQGRSQFIRRAEHNALMTIPSFFPPEGRTHDAHLLEAYNGLGGAAVLHLASRITMNLLPANRPHMRLDLPAEILIEVDGKVPKEVETGLALSERMVQGEVESLGWRPVTLQSLHQLLVAGNVCENMLPDGSLRLFRLDQYVVVRDFSGMVTEAVIEEKLSRSTLPPDVLGGPKAAREESGREDEEVMLYTRIEWDGKFYQVTQEADGKRTGLKAEFTKELLPYSFLRWSSTPGEDYGRGKVEEHAPDFRALEGLEKAGLEVAAMASRNFIAVRPGSFGSSVKRRLTRAVNGDVIMVDPDAVEGKSFTNAAGFQIIDVQMNRLIERVSRAFLLLSAGQRDAERVTATEIERDINELEAALGGNFSILNKEMMERRTTLLMDIMTKDGKLPEALRGATQPTILTGLEALSRERDVVRVRQLAEIAAAFGPEVAQDELNLNKILGRATIGLGFADVLNSSEEKAAIQQQRQQAAVAQAAAGPAAGQLAGAARDQAGGG